MSASLVGSEMCIRDSHAEVQCELLRSPDPPAGWRWAVWTQAWLEPDKNPAPPQGGSSSSSGDRVDENSQKSNKASQGHLRSSIAVQRAMLPA
eukprot:4129428-Alexandrium_andersonii.AAC.1